MGEKIPRLSLFLIAALFAAALLLSTFAFYAKVRLSFGLLFNEVAIASVLALVLKTLFQYSRIDDLSLTRKLYVGFLAIVLIYGVGYGMALAIQPDFIPPAYAGGYAMRAGTWPAVLVANVIGMVSILALATSLRLVHSLIFFRRKKNTQTYFNLFVFFGVLTIVSATLTGRPLRYDPKANHVLTFVLLLITTGLLGVNALRVGWVAVLNRRQKFFTFLAGLLFIFLTSGLLALPIGSGVTLSDMVESYSIAAGAFLFLTTIFIFAYTVTTTVNSLLHLPAAAIYDKRVKEINSIYTLSRAINSVFDFEKIIIAVTDLVCEATNSNACWVEISREKNPSKREDFRFVGLKTRPPFHVHFLEVSSKKYLSGDKLSKMIPSNDLDYLHYLHPLVDWILANQKPAVLSQVKRDKMTRDLIKTPIESLAAIPLVTTEGFAGIIYAVKSIAFGFDQDDVATISAFANQAAVAIENTRLVKASLEKERLQEELRIAHEVQMRLIPQETPRITNDKVRLDVSAMTIPANEVGGDYYDFIKLEEWRTGIVVGDVSGKGTSAAFYMAEIKGIIQALAGIYKRPKELLVAVNEVLFGSMDRKSFITLIYVDYDLSKNQLTFARAGHCPLLHVQAGGHEFARPNGIGLGLDGGSHFRNSIEEQTITIEPDDVFVLYSDGLVEARSSQNEEFGDERLQQVVQAVRHLDAEAIRSAILQAVERFASATGIHDDLTCVVLKTKPLEQPVERRLPSSSVLSDRMQT